MEESGAGKRRRKDARWTAEGVRKLRDHLGLTQQEMADELGVRQQTISEWETGLYSPRGGSTTLLKIVAERAGFVYRAEGSLSEEATATRNVGSDHPTV